MKKCPYCFSLMNNDEKICPKCLKNVENVPKMKEVAPKENKLSFYTLAFGVIISLGSVAASLSQRENKINYQNQYNEVLNQFNSATDSATKASLQTKGEALLSSAKTCAFREIVFYVMIGVGAFLVLYSLFHFLYKKYKQKAK